MPETAGPGCAFLDYDNDGWMDIYLVNSGNCDFYQPSKPLRNALYRNNRDGTFTDVTEKAGVPGNAMARGSLLATMTAMVYLTSTSPSIGRNILYHNNGDGTFTDVTAKAGVAAPGWATSAVWFDYDNDGRLDLFVCRFRRVTARAKNVYCGSRRRCSAVLHAPRVLARARVGSSTTMATARSPTSARKSGIAKDLGQGLGGRGR